MAILSDMLQFKHHTCARGGTVEKPFLADLAAALGITKIGRHTKDELLGAIYTHVTGDVSPPLGDPDSIYSPGSTVTDHALQLVIDGVRSKGLAKVSLVAGAPAARIAVTQAGLAPDRDPFQDVELPEGREDALRAAAAPTVPADFRHRVLAAYGNSCAVTGCDVQDALEVTYVDPTSPNGDAVTNGICLRADLRRLWDAGRLAIHEATHAVLLDERMVGTDYSMYVGEILRVPMRDEDVPSSAALEQHREWCGL